MVALCRNVILRSAPIIRSTRRGLATAAKPTPQHQQAQSITSRSGGQVKPAKSTGTTKYNTTTLSTAIGERPWSTLMLRDMCTCPQCIDPSSGQKNFLTTDIPAAIEGKVINDSGDSVTIQWTNDIPHHGNTTIAKAEIDVLSNRILPFPARKLWAADDIAKETTDFAYEDYMNNDEVLHKVLRQLRMYGLAFLKGVPEQEESVAKIAERVGPLRNSLYGLTWDVRSVPDAQNVAYTSKDLGFHMDLLPFTSPPALQFLHCVRTSAKGGSSLFMDSYRAAQELADTDMEAYTTLAKTPVMYHYNHPGSHLYQKRWTTFEGRYLDPVNYRKNGGVRWSPPFQAPLSRGLIHAGGDKKRAPTISQNVEAVAEWHSAAGKFNALINKPEGIVDRMMKPGEAVLFHNTRVLHARTAFEANDAGKERWLRGAYVDQEPWESKMRVLFQRYGAAEV